MREFSSGVIASLVLTLTATASFAGQTNQILAGQTLNGSLFEPDESDTFVFAGTSGTLVTILMAPIETPYAVPRAELHGPDGRFLTASIANAETISAVVQYVLRETGRYTIHCSDDVGTSNYFYRLGLAKYGAENQADARETNQIAHGHTVTASLGIGDLDTFDFPTVRGNNVTLELVTTNGQDSLLVQLYAPCPTGPVQLASVVADGTSAAISLPCVTNTGRCQILCRGVRGDELVNYSLSLRQNPVVPPDDVGNGRFFLAIYQCATAGTNRIFVRWSTEADIFGMFLENADLLGGREWRPFATPGQVFDRYWHVEVTGSVPQRYFRLRCPP